MSWQRRLKKGTATATRSAQLWSLNDYDLDGFMEELVEGTPSDGISDVDWEDVAHGFNEEIKQMLEDFGGDEE